MGKVKVFVHASNADADAGGRAMTLAPQTLVPAHYKWIVVQLPVHSDLCAIFSNNSTMGMAQDTWLS